ncbi:uracil/xanthine transporter [Paenibacillus thermotolerans]|uniref:uracil/xanthine transporter n=1 Tax=Paenibacillus thermotolerans TaxID=3027807 RepID=UPI0023686166|nr:MULTISPECIES: uracil/xanthine transporter [unclassified Paenibacillus]
MPKSSALTTSFASLQWFFFIFANTVVVPISIGTAFQLPPDEIAGILRSSLIFTGLAGVIQGLIGHRFPLMEGHSGVMWGLLLNLSVSASSMGMSLTSIGGGIATGMLLAGIVVAVLGALNLMTFIQKLFTPMVMSVYLFLLTFQLILIFFKGMLKISEDGSLDVPVSLFSVGIVIFVSLLKIKGKSAIGNFSILIGIIAGWLLYVLLFPSESAAAGGAASLHVPLFPFGLPNGNVGIIAITFLASMLNMSNNVAAVRAVSDLLQEEATQSRLHRSFILTGVYSVAAAVLGLVSYAPFSSSIGFLESTRIFDRKPFLIGGALMSILGLIPAFGGLLAGMPVTVGNAVLFVAYLQLFGTSLKSLKGTEFNSVTIHRLAVPVLAGVGIMNVDVNLFGGLPVLVRAFVTNGFIMGVLISILMEMTINWEKA